MTLVGFWTEKERMIVKDIVEQSGIFNGIDALDTSVEFMIS